MQRYSQWRLGDVKMNQSAKLLSPLADEHVRKKHAPTNPGPPPSHSVGHRTPLGRHILKTPAQCSSNMEACSHMRPRGMLCFHTMICPLGDGPSLINAVETMVL